MPNDNTPISLARYEQLCTFNVPYSGYIRDNSGNITIRIETEIEQATANLTLFIGCFYKRIKVRIVEVQRKIQKGDNLWAIAQMLKVTPESIVGTSTFKEMMRNPQIKPFKVGDTLTIKTNLRYGYQIQGLYDENSFKKGFEKGLPKIPLSEHTLYKATNLVQSMVDEITSSLADNAGKSTFGFGGKYGICVYIEKPSGGVFWGNQSQKVFPMEVLGKSIQQWICPHGIPALAFLFQGFEVGEGIYQDGGMFGQNAWIQTTGAAAGIFGGIGGGALGARAGKSLAKLFRFGGIPGKIIGAIAGGIIGGNWAEKVAEEKVRTMFQSSSGKMQQMSEKEIEELMKSSKAGYWD